MAAQPNEPALPRLPKSWEMSVTAEAVLLESHVLVIALISERLSARPHLEIYVLPSLEKRPFHQHPELLDITSPLHQTFSLTDRSHMF